MLFFCINQGINLIFMSNMSQHSKFNWLLFNIESNYNKKQDCQKFKKIFIFMDYIDKKCRTLQFSDSNDINRGVLKIQLKFRIILKAGLLEFLSKYSKKWCKF